MESFGIGANQLLEILHSMKALDEDNLNAAAVGLEMIKCTSQITDDNRSSFKTNRCKNDLLK